MLTNTLTNLSVLLFLSLGQAELSPTCYYAVRQTRTGGDQGSFTGNEILLNSDVTEAIPKQLGYESASTGPGISVLSSDYNLWFGVGPVAVNPVDKWDVEWKYGSQGPIQVFFQQGWTPVDGDTSKEFRIGAGSFDC